MINTEKLRAAAVRAVEQCGAEGYEIKINNSVSASAETLQKEINSVSYTNSGSVSIRVILNGKSGFAGSDLVTEEEVEKLVYRACENAKAVDDKDEVSLFEGSERYEKVKESNAELPSADELKAYAMELQSKLYDKSDKVVDGSQSFAGCQSSESVYISSAGLDLSYSDSFAYGGVYAAVKDGENADSDYQLGLVGKKTADQLVDTAVETAVFKLGAESVDSGKYNIIIGTDAMSSLLAGYSSVFSAKSAFLKISKLANKEGEKVASELISIYDDPFHPEKFGKCPFDREGVAVYKKAVIESGVLKTLLYNRMYAKRMGKETTGNAASATDIAPSGLYIEAGDLSHDELLLKLGNGLFITGFQGLHAGVNAQSGDFSLQAEGYLVENGKKTKPVKNITVADNFYTLLEKVSAISNKVEFPVMSSIGSPEIMFTDIAISGK